MSSNPNALVRDHEPSDSDSKPLLDPGHAEAGTSHEFHNPVYQPDYRYSYTDENFKYYPSGPDQSQAKLDDPFTPKPEQYNQPQDYARQTRYEDMGEYAMQLCLNGASSEPPPSDYAEEQFHVPASKSRAMTDKQPNMFQRYFGLYPLSQRIEDKRRGVGVQKYPIACTPTTQLFRIHTILIAYRRLGIVRGDACNSHI